MANTGNLELYSAWRNVLEFMPMVAVAGTYSRPLTKPVLYKALSQLIAKQPLLRVNLFTKGKTLVMRQLPEFDLDAIVEFVEETDLDAFVNKRILDNDTRDKIAYNDDSKPVWRLYILGASQAIWAFDHGPFDGNSGPAFHQLLLAELEVIGTETDVSYSSKISLPAGELEKSLEQQIDMSLPLHYILKVAWHLLCEWFRPPSNWTGIPPSVPFDSKSLFIEVDAASTTKLLAKARANKVSLTALLSGAWAYVLEQKIPANRSNRDVLITCPVNARRYLKAPGALGNFVYSFDYTFSGKRPKATNASEKIVGFATEYAPKLAHAVNQSKEPGYVVGLLDLVDIKDYLEKEGKGRRGALGEVSNLGAINVASGTWTITSMAFTQASCSTDAPYILSLISVSGAGLTISVSVAADDKDRTKCHEIGNLVQEALNALLE